MRLERNFFLRIAPFVILGIYFIFLFHKIFLNGLWPIPADSLVSYFFPWNRGGWEGWYEGIAHKGLIGFDVFRHYVPWKSLGTEMVRSGQLPLWNPYNFAGNPLLANYQSSFFYPLGILFYFLPIFPAWIIFVLLQPPVGFFGFYLYLRQIVKNKAAAIFGALGFISSAFFLAWFVWGMVGHSFIWVGWLLWLAHCYFWQKSRKHLILLPFFIFIAVISPYPQVTILILILTFAYSFFGFWANGRDVSSLARWVGATILGVSLAAIQIFPTLELWSLSSRENGLPDVFQKFAFQKEALITLLAPDFFGNIATNNFWGNFHYHEHNMYFGAAVLICAVFSIKFWRSNNFVRFFSVACLLALASIFPLIASFEKSLPILSTGIPSRAILIIATSVAALSAIGLEGVIRREYKRREWLIIFILFFCFYLILWLVAILNINFGEGKIVENFRISFKNLIIPSVVSLVTFFSIYFYLSKKMEKTFFVLLLLLLVLCEAGYFFNKFTPFAPAKFFMPSHVLLSDLSKLAKIDRVWGYDRSHLSANYNTYYRYQVPTGYESLYIKRYGELLKSSETGRLDRQILRGDTDLPKTNSSYREKLANLLGIKYFTYHIDSDTDDRLKGDDPRFADKLSKEYLQVRTDRWNIAQNPNVYPRAFLVGNFEVSTSDEDIIKKMFSNETDLRKEVILEKTINLPLDKATGDASIEDYAPNSVRIKTASQGNNLLFLSDNFYPGWHAYVDGTKSEIYRADYTFRAVYVPKGEHEVVFKYEPNSVRTGIILSTLSLCAYLGLVGGSTAKRKKSKSGRKSS